MTKRTMTKRKKTSKMGSVNMSQVVYTALGAVAARLLVNTGSKAIPFLKSPINKAISQIGLGLVTKPLAGLIGTKSPNIDALGSGMMVGGVYELIKATAPAVLGQAEGDGEDIIVVSGMDISEVNGMDDIGMDISEINGMDDIGYYGEEDTF